MKKIISTLEMTLHNGYNIRVEAYEANKISLNSEASTPYKGYGFRYFVDNKKCSSLHFTKMNTEERKIYRNFRKL